MSADRTTNEKYVAFMGRAIRAAGDRVDGDVAMLADLVGLRDQLDDVIASSVHHLRSEEGGAHSWREVADALGVTAQAAQQRYGGEGARKAGGQPAGLR